MPSRTQSLIGVEIIGLEEVEEMIGQLANFMGKNSALLFDVLWATGEEMRKQCQLMCTQVVYDTPESPTYRRTGFLRAAMVISTQGKWDYPEVKARAQSLAASTYPNRNIGKVYRFVHMQPYTARRAVRVTSGAIYSDYVEYGTAKMGPRPFMRAGISNGESKIIGVAVAGIKQIVADIERGRAAKKRRGPGGQFIGGYND